MKFFFSVLFLFSNLYIIAQQRKLDSLLLVNERYQKPDSQKVIYLTGIFRQYARINNIDKMEEYSNRAIAIAKTLPQTFSLTYVYERIGLCYHGKSKYLQAIQYYNEGIAVAKRRNDKYAMGGFYTNLSALYGSIPDYAKALETNEMAVQLYNDIGEKDYISNCYMNIGSVYIDLHQPVNAVNYINKAMAFFKTADGGINYGVSCACQGIAKAYLQASDEELKLLGLNPSNRYTEALDILKKGLMVAKNSQGADDLEGNISKDIGEIYEKTGNREQAIYYYRASLSILEKNESKEHFGNILYTLGHFYYTTNDLQKSISYLKQSLAAASSAGLLSIQQNALQMLSTVYEKKGMIDSAFAFYKQYIVVKENIIDQEKEKEITRKQLKLDFSIKENDYKLSQQITDGKLRQQVLLAKQQEQSLQLKQQQLQLVNKEKDLQRLTYLAKQAELQNAQQVQASLMQKNAMQAKYDNDVNGKQIAKQKLQISYDENVKLILGGAIGLALIFTAFIFYNQRKTVKLNRIISLQKEELEKISVVKDKIFSVVSHDMRAPVNSLISFIDILDAGAIPQEKLALYSKELKQNLSYTSALMNNLLNWAASQMQGFKAVSEKFDLSVLAGETVLTLQHHIIQKKVIVTNKIATNTIVNADRNMMAAVLRNIISNAVKYSYTAGAVTLNSKYNTAAGCTIFINDEGTGMSDAALAHFNAHSQQPAESKRGTANEKGTGLGLLLCKTFIEQMGGNIKAYNTEKGMCFEVLLPA